MPMERDMTEYYMPAEHWYIHLPCKFRYIKKCMNDKRIKRAEENRQTGRLEYGKHAHDERPGCCYPVYHGEPTRAFHADLAFHTGNWPTIIQEKWVASKKANPNHLHLVWNGTAYEAYHADADVLVDEYNVEYMEGSIAQATLPESLESLEARNIEFIVLN